MIQRYMKAQKIANEFRKPLRRLFVAGFIWRILRKQEDKDA